MGRGPGELLAGRTYHIYNRGSHGTHDFHGEGEVDRFDDPLPRQSQNTGARQLYSWR